MSQEEIGNLKGLIGKQDVLLQEREKELNEKYEEINAQKEELAAAIDQLIFVNNQLVDKNKELDQILYKASHDLISPMISIEGILGLMKKEEKSPLLNEFLNHIGFQNSKMKVIIAALNSLSRINQEEWNFENLNVFEIAKASVESLSFLNNFHNVDISYQIDVSLDINFDKQILETILKNMVSNSINYRTKSNKNGFINIDINTNNNKLFITVEDDGDGISDDISSKIYDIFYRGNIKSTGLGLGLYFIKKIAQRMNGELFYKTKNKNLVFYVILDLKANFC